MLLTQMIFQTAPVGAADPMGGLMGMLPLFAMIPIFYFLLIRPQNQRAKKMREMIAALKKGDTVVTAGGIIGKIVKETPEEITIDNGEGVKLRIMRGMVVEVRGKTEPVAANDAKES